MDSQLLICYWNSRGEIMPRINVNEELVAKLDYVRSCVMIKELKKNNRKPKKLSNTDILNEALCLYAEKHGISIE